METGSALNTLIAERIMGWKKVHLPDRQHGLDWIWDRKEGCYWYEAQTVPPYSQDLSFAWEVVQKLRNMDFSIDVCSYPESREWLEPPYRGAKATEWVLTKGKLHYQCTISKYESDIGSWVCIADELGNTPEHAICLSALKATSRE